MRNNVPVQGENSKNPDKHLLSFLAFMFLSLASFASEVPSSSYDSGSSWISYAITFGAVAGVILLAWISTSGKTKAQKKH